jgi:capsular polysaccharide transport system permease protein
VIFALFLREIKTRFGKFRLGYVWAFLEPVLHVAIIVTIMGVRKMRSHYPGMDTPVFLLTGIVPFFMFRHIVAQLAGAIDANQGLFNYRQVKPMDTMLTRVLLEGLIYLVVYVVLMIIVTLLGFRTSIADPLGLIMIYFALFCFSFGMGVFFGVLNTIYEEAKKILPIILQPLYFLSAVLFPMRMVPIEYQPWLTWNPILHFMEVSRSSFFATYNTTTGSLLYIVISTVLMVSLGLLFYWVKRRELVAS